ncbi:MAG TPA: D-sedoheptulose 7-phosphate isomerase [Anaerolineales bacterium]
MIPPNIGTELNLHQQILEQTIQQSAELINKMVICMVACFQQGNKILLCGNGGSAADAQHVAGEFVNRFRYDHAALPAIALSTDTSILTAIGNDSAFENIFSRQVEALAKPGDILVGISTSGASPDILKALETGRLRGMTTMGFTGEKGRENMSPKCDYCLVVSSADTPRIQECHIFVWHVICGMIEKTIFPVNETRR